MVFNDGSEEPAPDDEVTVSGFDPSKIGGQTLKVSCRGFETGFEVLVNISEDHEHTPAEKTVIIEPTCTEPGKAVILCSVCQAVIEEFEIEPKGHSFGEWVIETPPGVGIAGVLERTCTVCSVKENLQVDQLYRYVSDDGKTITYILEGEGQDAFPAGTRLVRTDLFPILTMGESIEYEKLCKSVSAMMLDISLVRIGAPDGSVMPEGNVFVTLKAPHGSWKEFILFVDGIPVTSDHKTEDGTLRFIMPGDWKANKIIMIAGVPDITPATEPESSGTSVPDETEPVSPGTGEDTTVPVTPDTTASDITDPVTTESPIEGDETTAKSEETVSALSHERIRSIAVGIGAVIGSLFVISCIATLIYRRFIY
ncbi:MAG: hypothetical protein MJ137_06910 [Clostridia bacterium]|nr:hypothetical protein [Clostridia bacterium]